MQGGGGGMGGLMQVDVLKADDYPTWSMRRAALIKLLLEIAKASCTSVRWLRRRSGSWSGSGGQEVTGGGGGFGGGGFGGGGVWRRRCSVAASRVAASNL